MNKIHYYIESFRLRTLPLSLSGVILGGFLAAATGVSEVAAAAGSTEAAGSAVAMESVGSSVAVFRTVPFVLAILTTLCLQILSNLANEWGDLKKGTDNGERLGPIRSIQSGALSIDEFKHTIFVFVGLSAVSGLALLYFSFGSLFAKESLIMLGLGALAIVAAIKYTVGKGAYGYYGLGDLFVFIFFGLVSVCGSYFVIAHTFTVGLLLPGAAIGMLSMGVLNLNNMRDIENDAQCGKRTIPVMIGLAKARIYHCVLIIGSLICFLIYAEMHCYAMQHAHTLDNQGFFENYTRCVSFMFLIAAPVMALHLRRVFGFEGKQLDGELKVLSLSTLLVAVLFGLGQVIS